MRQDVFDLKKLGEELSLQEMSEMMARRALRQDLSPLAIKDAFNDALRLMKELPIRDAFSGERGTINGNIDGLIELRGLKTLPYKYLKFDYHAVNYLEQLGFVTVTPTEKFFRDTITGTQALEDFISTYEEEDGYPFYDVNEALLELVFEMKKNGTEKPVFKSPFYLETNQVWGQMTSQADLDNATKLLNDVQMNILDCKAVVDFNKVKPNFGTRTEHNGKLTLREWMYGN